MSAKKAKRIGSIIDTLNFFERNFRVVSKVNAFKSRWTAPAREDVMLLVREFEKHGIFDITPNRDELPREWTHGLSQVGSLPRTWPSFPRRWFNIFEGVGQQQVELLHRIIMLELKRREVPMAVTAGGHTATIEGAGQVCNRPDCVNIIQNTVSLCNWCGHTAYCTLQCQDLDFERHSMDDLNPCPGPTLGGQSAPSSSVEQSVKALLENVGQQLRDGSISIPELDALIKHYNTNELVALEHAKQLYLLQCIREDMLFAAEHASDSDCDEAGVPFDKVHDDFYN